MTEFSVFVPPCGPVGRDVYVLAREWTSGSLSDTRCRPVRGLARVVLRLWRLAVRSMIYVRDHKGDQSPEGLYYRLHAKRVSTSAF